MRWIIDGDGCPVKGEIIELGLIYHIPVIIVSSYDHYTVNEWGSAVTFHYVDPGKDGADFAILNLMQPDDWVFTQDYGLASLLLAKGRVFHHRGFEYHQDNIDELLLQRHHASVARRNKQMKHAVKGPAPFTAEDRTAFAQFLERCIHEACDK